MVEAALFLGAYLIGAIPFGFLIARAHGVNIFEVGSGNVGATNIKRALGLKWALIVFALDVLKGVAPALIAWQLKNDQVWAISAGAAAIVGHSFSPFLGFKGGKGVATALGAVIASSPLVAICTFGVFVITLGAFGYVSLSSLIAVPAAMFFTWVFGDAPGMYVFYGALMIFVVIRHRGNIQRLRAGTEPKFKLKDSSSPKPNAQSEAPVEKERSGMESSSQAGYSELRGDRV